MFKKDGEVKVYKDSKEVSPKVADETPERYTVDDLVEDVNKFKKILDESLKDPDLKIEAHSTEEK